MDEIFLAKFPFLNEAKIIFKNRHYDENSITSGSIINAKKRIVDSLSIGRIELKEIANQTDALNEIASFYTERILLGLINNTFITNRVSISEAKSYHEKRFSSIDWLSLQKVAQAMGINAKKNQNQIFVTIASFIQFAPDSIDYRLFYKTFNNGYVQISEYELKRITQESIKKKLDAVQPIKESLVQNQEIKNALFDLRKLVSQISAKKTKITINIGSKDHPPCIEKILRRLYAHENLSHYERWSLGVYLTNINMDQEQILNLYSNLPDFSEKITRYQLQHLENKEYKMPSCEKMKGYGLCVAECNIFNPLDWWNNARERKNLGQKENK